MWGLSWGHDALDADAEEARERAGAESMHPMTLQFGAGIAALFTADEAKRVWQVNLSTTAFPLSFLLGASEGDVFTPLRGSGVRAD